MDYQQTLNYLYNQLPMFTRIGASAFKTDLTNTIVLCERVGNPQLKFKSLHVGGTNGKGSTSHMLASILQKAGYKTGLYTSPHLRDFRERIRINGEMISEQEVVDFVAQYQHDFETIQPSFFEMTVAMAFDHFARHQVDIAIVEVGLGGRLDSTNIITPLLSVITNIGWDHMNLLGNTLPDIAREKAGIIKPNIPVIIGEYQQETAEVFTRKAAQENARIQFASEEFELLKSEVIDLQSGRELREIMMEDRLNHKIYNLKLDLTGTYQLKNVKTVLAAVTDLKAQEFAITDEHILTALQQVKILTGLHGRWEVINRHPLTICDAGHNPDGMIEVLKNIKATPYRHLHFVIGMVNDKDISKVLRMLPQEATFYFCKPDIPRGLEAASLQQQGATYGLKGNAYLSVKEAITAAQSAAEDADLVFVGGSTFVVAEAV
jgi:dihydrofolate synthase/folylpolyglutamate synthase